MPSPINRFPWMMVMVVLALCSRVTSARAVEIVDDPVQIDERAAQVVQTMNSLCWEMYRYHQLQPDYPQAYRTAKDLWQQAGALREALLNGPLETGLLQQQLSQMNDTFVRLDATLAGWGDGDRSSIATSGRPVPRTVVTDGVVVDLPLIGVQVGGPRYTVIEDDSPALQRRRLHRNSRGSKRSLERELAAVKQSLSYLFEDAGDPENPPPPKPGLSESGPVPQPPAEDATGSGQPVKIQPRGKK